MKKNIRIFILSVGLATAGAIVLSVRSEDAEKETTLLSGPYTIGIGTTQATVCWQTVDPVRGAARYRPAGGSDWQRMSGGTTRFHAITLDALKENTEYEVQAGSGANGLGRVTFRTASEKAEKFTFFVYGDTRSIPRDHKTVALALTAEAKRLKQFTFVVHSGDFAAARSDESDTATQFFRPAQVFLDLMPLVPVRGNHEAYSELFDKYFPVPERSKAGGGADDYYVDYGSVRVIVFDQYGHGNNTQRMAWMSERLVEAKDKWRFVVFHEPIYASGSHGSSIEYRRMLEPVLRKGKVHVVFCGHDHNYERTKSIGGVTYFTVGGGGAPLRPQAAAEPPPWSVKFQSINHFLTVSVSPKELTILAYGPGKRGDKFEVFDSVKIPRKCDWP